MYAPLVEHLGNDPKSCLVYLIAINSINHTYNNIKYLCQAYNSVAFPVTA